MASPLVVGTGLAASGRRARPSEHFPDPFMDMASLAMPETIQDALRWCLVPGTPIETADFSLKPVEDIRQGDAVLTQGRTIERVKAHSVRNVDEEIAELCFAGLGKKQPLRITKNHKIPVFKAGRRKPSKIDFADAELIPTMAGDIDVGDYVVTPLPNRNPKVSRFDGWLVGMYLAEGCIVYDDERAMRVRFTLGQDDEEAGIAQRLVQLATQATGYMQSCYTPPSRPDTRLVTVSDPELSAYFADNAPGLAPMKQIGAIALEWSDTMILKVLAGMLDGDGSIDQRDGAFRGGTIWNTSKTLLYQLQRLANCVGLTPSLCWTHHSETGYGREAENDDSYALKFGKEDCQAFVDYSIKLTAAQQNLRDFTPKQSGPKQSFVQDDMLWRRVTGVAYVDYCGPVYNFEVENDHSYIANGICVKNCEYIIMANGPYRSAISRVISYFITDVEIVSAGGGDGEDRVGREEKQKYLDFLNDTLGIKNVLHTVALDYLTYGNSFTSLLVPFRRYLSCPSCGLELPLKKVFNTPDFGFNWSGFQFNAHCPHCSYNGTWKHIDRRSGESGQIKIKRWSPHELDILWDPHTDDTSYIWRIPDDYRQLVRKGHLFHLERASWEIIEAIKNNQALLFDPEVVYHMKEEALAGIRNRGWGISRVLANFRQAWYVQVLHRYNEAIALDYVIPFRVITPQPRPGQGGEVNDPVLSINMGSFTGRVQQMLKARRGDPARWNILPFPIEYQALGGDATQLAPKDLLELGMDTLLTAVGLPVELYKGSLSVQSAPAALRLFEANWSHLVHNLNRFLARLVDKIAQIMSWEPVNCRLQRVTHADDLNRQMAKLQLMMGGQISRTTGLSSVGVDFGEEERRKLEEERITAEATQDMQEEMEQSALMDEMAMPQDPAAMGGMPPGGAPQGGAQAGGQMPTFQGMPGAMPGGGMPTAQAAGQPSAPMGPMGQPMGPGGAVQSFMAGQPLLPHKPVTPEEMQNMATTLAQQAMAMPESQKQSFLIQLKKEDPTIHALVKSQLEEMKRDAQLRGGELIMAQEYGKQASALRYPAERPLRSIILD